MMLRRFSVLALAAFAMSACNRQAEPVAVVIDEDHMLYSASRTCPPPQSLESPCVGQQQFLARDFETTLSSQFAALRACAGLLIAKVNITDEESISRLAKRMIEAGGNPNKYWVLNVDFVPDAKKETWTLTSSPLKSPPTVFQGEGDASQIAAGVCNMVLGRSGTVAADRGGPRAGRTVDAAGH